MLACLAPASPAVAASSDGPAAAIHHTEHGVVHVVADDDAGIGYGYGYAVAKDQICLLAEAYVTVAGERSRFFGPQGIFDFQANGAKHSNLNSDLYYRQVLASGVIGRLTRSAPPLGVRAEVRKLMSGYVRGYNRYLADVGGAKGVRDPACHGKPWVRPITEELAYARGMQVAGLAGGGLGITGIGKAQPPLASSAPAVDLQESIASLGALGDRLGLGGAGSNAIALGSKATRSGAGMVLGNPHLPWDGDFRLYQAHFTIPGEMDAAGVTFIGVPLIVIGHTRGLAWSHTVSSAFRFTPFEMRLVPGRPTSYVIDGKTHAMTSRTLTVPVRRADGSVGEVKQTMWSTVLGPVFTELLGLPLFPWTPVSAYAFADANLENLRYLNHFYEVDRAQTVPALRKILERNQGIPWANTIAADAQGRSYYADHTVVPHVTDAKAASCNTALGIAAFALLRLPVLDGSRGGCQWGSDPDAVVPGIFGPRHLPSIVRDDYVENSNDSYWLTNPQQPLEGFARIIGDERTERSLRTRLGLRMIADRLAGRDGREGKTFTLDQLQDLLFEERQGAGELMRDSLVSLCRTLPLLPSTKAILVAPGDACDVLAKWDLHNRLGSRGALLFQRWAEIALHRPIPGPERRRRRRRAHRDLAGSVRSAAADRNAVGAEHREPDRADGTRRCGRGSARGQDPARCAARRVPVRAPGRRAHSDARRPGRARRLPGAEVDLGPGQGIPGRAARLDVHHGQRAARGVPADAHAADVLAVGRLHIAVVRRPDPDVLARHLESGALLHQGHPGIAGVVDRAAGLRAGAAGLGFRSICAPRAGHDTGSCTAGCRPSRRVAWCRGAALVRRRRRVRSHRCCEPADRAGGDDGARTPRRRRPSWWPRAERLAASRQRSRATAARRRPPGCRGGALRSRALGRNRRLA